MTWLRALCLCLLLPFGATFAQAIDPELQAARLSAQAARRSPTIDRDVFMRQAGVRDVSLSPDGRWLAFRRDEGSRVGLWIREIDSAQEHRVVANSEGTDAIWSGDGARLWLPDANGLGLFDLGDLQGRRVFRYDRARQQSFWLVDPHAPTQALIREKVAIDGAWHYRYLSVDAAGKVRLIHDGLAPLLRALLDPEGRLRYASGYDGAQFDTVIWQFGGDSPRELMRCPLPQQCRPVAYSETSVWALAHNGEDRMSLQRHDAGSDRWETLHSDPRGISDAVTILMQPDGKDWFAIAYRPDRLMWHGRTSTAHSRIASLQSRLAGANLDIRSSNDGRRWLLQASKANWQYDRLFLYDTAQDVLTPLFESERKAAVPAAQLADMLPMHWRGKGDVLLHGYAFLPKGVPLAAAPIMAFIHGGPYNRSDGEMDVGTQLMVNRGYIVFKPNFRGSTGYGLAYVRGTGGNFGRDDGALDDIISGIDLLLANGIGDARKQAILGHSFGGYASLLAVTHYPGRFRFAVPSAAPVDIAWTMEDVAVEGGSAVAIDGPPVEVLLPAYGLPYGDKAWHARMHRQSPLAHAAELRTPTYLWAGGRDDRVAVESLVRYTAEANPAFRPVLLIDPDAGHSPRGRLNSEALAWLIEDAANRHFGGGVTPPSPELQAFLDRNLHRPVAVKAE